MSLLHRLRAAVVIGFAWSIAWTVSGTALLLAPLLLGSAPLPLPIEFWPRLILLGALNLGAFGFAAGLAFALTLSKTARGRGLHDLSLSYAARWGAVAGAASIIVAPLTSVVVTWPLIVIGGAIFAFVGAASATTTLALARHAPLSQWDAPRRRQPNVRCSRRAID